MSIASATPHGVRFTWEKYIETAWTRISLIITLRSLVKFFQSDREVYASSKFNRITTRRTQPPCTHHGRTSACISCLASNPGDCVKKLIGIALLVCYFAFGFGLVGRATF